MKTKLMLSAALCAALVSTSVGATKAKPYQDLTASDYAKMSRYELINELTARDTEVARHKQTIESQRKTLQATDDTYKSQRKTIERLKVVNESLCTLVVAMIDLVESLPGGSRYTSVLRERYLKILSELK